MLPINTNSLPFENKIEKKAINPQYPLHPKTCQQKHQNTYFCSSNITVLKTSESSKTKPQNSNNNFLSQPAATASPMQPFKIETSVGQPLYNLKSMSTLGRRQLLPSEKALKYEFSLQILKFVCELPLPCSIRFMWKRNNKSIETKNTYDAKPGLNELTLNEKLSNISTIIFNNDNKTFLPKESELVVNMYFNGSPKKLASCQLDMRSILDPKDIRTQRSQTYETPLNLYIKNSRECKLTYRLSCTFKEEVATDKNIGPGPLNTSGFSMQQDKYFEKKYDIPSKDNHSVNSYATGGIRYPSGSKRDRDDSSSIRKYQYGYLGGLKSNISNQVMGKDFDANSGMKSIDNKTEMNEGNYLNRQLIDEQNKRSKAQSQLARNKVEISELKKKINELSIQNMTLKEQIKNSSQLQESTSKEEMNSLQFKLYELNNEIRQIKNNLDIKKRDADKLEIQCSKLRNDKSNYQSQVQSKQKRIEELQKTLIHPKLLEPLQNENQDLKFQIENLRRYIEDVNRQHSEQQTRLRSDKLKETQELNYQIDQLRKELERMKNKNDITEEQQKKINEYEDKLKNKQNQAYIVGRNLALAQQEIQQYKNRLAQVDNQRSYMQRQFARIKQQSLDKTQSDKQQQQSQHIWLSSQNQKLKDQLQFYQQQLQQAQLTLSKQRQQSTQNQSKTNRLLPQINQLQKKVNEYETEINTLRTHQKELEREKYELQKQVEQLKDNVFQSNISTTTNPEADKLFRETLNMQVELQFANDQLNRLRGVEEALEDQKWKAQKEQTDRLELQQQYERIQKQLTNKSRALLIQIQKSKLLNEQANEHMTTATFYKEELQKNRNIIYELEQQLNELSNAFSNKDQLIRKIETENNQLKAEKIKMNSVREEIKTLQDKNKELQARNNEKLETLETINRNLILANGEIKDLQQRNEELHREHVNRDKLQYDLESRCKQLEKQKGVWESELTKAHQDKRTLEKRNQLIMSEIHVMKKKFEEEKGRSLSFTRNEDFNKVRTLEFELDKKEKTISKLNKQKLELEEQNVKINVQVMKLLSELQKTKACGYSTQTGLKTINSLK